MNYCHAYNLIHEGKSYLKIISIIQCSLLFFLVVVFPDLFQQSTHKIMYNQTDVIVGVYNTHHALVEALKELKSHHFPMEHVGVVGKGESLDSVKEAQTWEEVVDKGTLIGSAVGLLAGISMVVVPGLGLLYLGGSFLAPIVGGITGTTLGAMGGTILGTILGAKHGTEGSIQGHEDHLEDAAKYKEYIEKDKFLLLVHGPKSEVETAHKILEEHGQYDTVGVHLFVG
jgi:hypothetical protein